jgi:hypothetical protein
VKRTRQSCPSEYTTTPTCREEHSAELYDTTSKTLPVNSGRSGPHGNCAAQFLALRVLPSGSGYAVAAGRRPGAWSARCSHDTRARGRRLRSSPGLRNAVPCIVPIVGTARGSHVPTIGSECTASTNSRMWRRHDRNGFPLPARFSPRGPPLSGTPPPGVDHTGGENLLRGGAKRGLLCCCATPYGPFRSTAATSGDAARTRADRSGRSGPRLVRNSPGRGECCQNNAGRSTRRGLCVDRPALSVITPRGAGSEAGTVAKTRLPRSRKEPA